jgi:uncharacterized protein (TIGR00255 family)
MIQSMTGYGQASAVFNHRKLNVELRALNGKTTDIRIKFPAKYGSKELAMRNQVLNKLEHGRFDMTISIDGVVEEQYKLDEQLFRSYFKTLNELAKDLGVKEQDYFSTIIRIPNVVKNMVEELTDDEWTITEALIESTIDQIIAYRMAEGNTMLTDIRQSVGNILVFLKQVEPHEKDRIQGIKDRVSNSMNGFFNEIRIDENRFEQELLYYIERLDINEEKIRLEQNCNYFMQLLDDPSVIGKGKKLIFISQEIGREINTMGAKAQFAPIQQLVVNMKDELERVKELLLNVL